ncbi:MAG TPA: alpha/beta fold hydrolase [Planctomycetota bacterium]|nr:alpha/beta fold hydrolase [Planctomycetota bacterium]
MSPALATDDLAERRAILAGLEGEYPFASHLLDLGDARLHYLDEGPRDGEALVVVHGNPTWSFYWRHALRRLRGTRRCVAPDHIGCGLSDKPADYSYRLTQHIENLERLLDALALERITLIVHDWGGPIGLGFAGRHPERVARLVITNTAAFPGPAPLCIRACRTPLLGALAVRGLNAFAGLATVMAVEDASRMTPTVRRGYLAPYSSWATRIATLRFVEDIPLSPHDASWSALLEVERGLARLAAKPACLIWGEKDWCFTPAYRRGFEERLPRARVHKAEHAGHYVLEDAREEVLDWIEGFLADHPLPQ